MGVGCGVGWQQQQVVLTAKGLGWIHWKSGQKWGRTPKNGPVSAARERLSEQILSLKAQILGKLREKRGERGPEPVTPQISGAQGV